MTSLPPALRFKIASVEIQVDDVVIKPSNEQTIDADENTRLSLVET